MHVFNGLTGAGSLASQSPLATLTPHSDLILVFVHLQLSHDVIKIIV